MSLLHTSLNSLKKYIRSQMKPRLYVVGDFFKCRKIIQINDLRSSFTIFKNASISIKTLSPHKYDLVFFAETGLWPGCDCLLDFNQVILFVSANITNKESKNDINRILSAGTLVCDSEEVFLSLSQRHPRVFLLSSTKNAKAKHQAEISTSQSTIPTTLLEIALNTFKFSRKPKFRNDDISAENNLKQLVQFCDVFSSHGFSQVHGVLLKGKTSETFFFNGEEVAYEGYPSISKLTNAEIRDLSRGYDFEARTDLIDYLNASPDEIALHGLYHTDHSTMSIEELLSEMGEGLSTLRRLFPTKPIRYFIAPFNRTSELTYLVASELGLRVLALDGVHLEAGLSNLQLESNQWYRYHHHRFYPDSKFPHFSLSINSLNTALSRQKLAERALN